MTQTITKLAHPSSLWLQWLRGTWQRLSLVLIFVMLTANMAWAESKKTDYKCENCNKLLFYLYDDGDGNIEIKSNNNINLGYLGDCMTDLLVSVVCNFCGVGDCFEIDPIPHDFGANHRCTRCGTYAPHVTYIDADGQSQMCFEYTELSGGGETTLSPGWYLVNSDINYTGKITLEGNVNLILADGKTMTVTNTGATPHDYAIYGNEKTLHIYGQSLGTGALTATAVGGSNAIILEVSQKSTSSLLGIHGGVVTTSAPSGTGISVQCDTDAGGIVIDGGRVTASGNKYGIYCEGGHFNILGGQVTATGTNLGGLGICDGSTNPGVLTLGCSKATDFISTNNIYNYSSESYAGEVKIATGQTLSDGTNSYDDQTASATLAVLTNVTLTKPTYGVTANQNPAAVGEYWATFYNPVAGYRVGAGEKAYIGSVNGNSLTLTEITYGIIPANTAVVLKATSNSDTYSFNLTRTATASSFDFSENSLLGGATVADGKVAYTLAAKSNLMGFYKFTGALNPYKAHLEITPPINGARSFYGFGENATAITAPESAASTELSGAWYTLDGRKLQGMPTQKGLYIVNGKKVVIK